MRPFLLLAGLLLILFSCSESNSVQRSLDPDKDYELVTVGFYNVENLFDTVDTEGKEDEEYTPEGENNWDTEKYEDKLSKLAEVIGELGTERTPHGLALLGLSEVENRAVLEDLVKEKGLAERNYRIVHEESPDERGIDVALLYRPDYFKVDTHRTFEVDLPGTDRPTRDQLLVSGELRGERVHLMVTHWPSRYGGQAASAPKRVKAARVGRKVVDSLQAAEEDPKVIYMGDLNDDPVNKSVQEVLKAKGEREDLKEEELYNPMRKLFDKGIGTLAWRDNWNLFDQIILSRPLANGELDSFRYYEAHVHNPEKLRQKEGNFKGYPFRSFVGSDYRGGYSDHFPVYIYLLRERR